MNIVLDQVVVQDVTDDELELAAGVGGLGALNTQHWCTWYYRC